MSLLVQDLTSEERFHVELHFSPGVKGVEEEENAPTGFGFRPASAEVARQVGPEAAECLHSSPDTGTVRVREYQFNPQNFLAVL